jgi:hypothetical protein
MRVKVDTEVRCQPAKEQRACLWPPGIGRDRKWILPQTIQKDKSCPQLDFRLLASTAVKQYISVCLATCLVVIWYSSFKKVIRSCVYKILVKNLIEVLLTWKWLSLNGWNWPLRINHCFSTGYLSLTHWDTWNTKQFHLNRDEVLDGKSLEN